MGMVAYFAGLSESEAAKLRREPDLVESYLFPDDGDGEPPYRVGVDKAWHAIHFMLAGTAGEAKTPVGSAVLGGTEIGPDLGYGPSRVLSPAQVRAIASHLEALPPEEFASRYAPAAMDAEHVYPEIWVRDGREGLEYILQHYGQMRTFYLDARDRGDGAILWIS